MIDFISKIDKDLAIRFRDILSSWENYNSMIYVPIQTYLEQLLKLIIRHAGKGNYLNRKESLGSLLDYRFVRAILEDEYQIKDLRRMQEINASSNQYKHEAIIGFDEDKAKSYIEFVFDLTRKHAFNLKILEEDSSVEYNFLVRKIDRGVFEQQTHAVVINDSENLNEKLLRKLEHISSQKVLVEKSIENIDSFVIDEPLSTTQIKISLEQIDHDLDELEDELVLHPELSSKLDDLNRRREILLLQLNKDSLFRSEMKEAYRTRLEINDKNLTGEISRLLDSQKPITHASEYATVKSVGAFDTFMQGAQTSFRSNFIENEFFTIFGVFNEDLNSHPIMSYFAIVFNQLIRGNGINTGEYIKRLENLDEEAISDIYKIEIAILMLLRNEFMDDKVWKINVVNRDRRLLNIALTDLIFRVERIALLCNFTYTRPTFETYSQDPDEKFHNISFDVFYPTSNSTLTITRNFNQKKLAKLWIQPKLNYKIQPTDRQKIVLNQLLDEFFGFKEFKVGQAEILYSTLNGEKTIGILTTGGGKSLIYHFAGLMQPKVTIYIGPINALIHDQYKKLIEVYKIDRCQKIVSESGGEPAKKIILDSYLQPKLFSFCSPERFQDRNFRELLISLNENGVIGLIVFDEVHCLSEWGHDFRISYLMLTHTINSYCPDLQFLGLTATAAVNVIKDLQVELGIFNPKSIIFNRNLQRENLDFQIREFDNYREMEEGFSSTLRSDYNDEQKTFRLSTENPKGYIVFFKKIKELDRQFAVFCNSYQNEITKYNSHDKSTQDDFMNNQKSLMFATSAFGMGIDKPNIRKTIHFGMPSSRESFFQEAGRSGRDGQKAECHLFTFKTHPKVEIFVNRFLDLNTPIQSLKDLQESFGKELTDLESNAYFFTRDFARPEVEAKIAIAKFGDLQKINDSGVAKYRIDKSSGDKQKEERNLYILHKVGIVRNWEVKYLYSKSGNFDVIDFTVYLHPDYLNVLNWKNTAMQYISQYSASEEIMDKIEGIKDLNQLETLIRIMRTWYQNTFLRSKREQMANMVEFVKKYRNRSMNQAIQDELSRYFDITNLLERRDSKKSLTFDQLGIKDVISRARRVKSEEIEELRVSMDRLLETEENDRINLFTSLMYLKSGQFETRNGRERLKYLLKKADDGIKKEIYQSTLGFYQTCDENQQKKLLEVLYEADKNLFITDLFGGKYIDDIVSEFIIDSINERYSNLF